LSIGRAVSPSERKGTTPYAQQTPRRRSDSRSSRSDDSHQFDDGRERIRDPIGQHFASAAPEAEKSERRGGSGTTPAICFGFRDLGKCPRGAARPYKHERNTANSKTGSSRRHARLDAECDEPRPQAFDRARRIIAGSSHKHTICRADPLASDNRLQNGDEP
jgi:hypothetical protein